MAQPPLIGLPGRRDRGAAVSSIPEAFAEIDLDIYLADYARRVTTAGGLPVNLPIDIDVSLAVERLDGLVLTGGADIDPRHYGHPAHPDLLQPEPERDDLELALLDGALGQGMPVLGICRGMQVINIHQGGTLDQHVPTHSRYDAPFTSAAHRVDFAEGSTLRSLYGPNTKVNSLHHQVIADVGEGLSPTAWAEDGNIEGLEMGRNVLAVQWHPELIFDRAEPDPVFTWLVEQARSSREPYRSG